MATKVTLHSISGAGPKQTAIAQTACVLIEQSLNDPRFLQMVSSAQYRETRFRDASGTSMSIGSADLPAMILEGRERGTEADFEIDLKVNLDRFRRGTLGSTVPGVLPFRTAYWFINDCIKYDEPAELAGHFIHEWLHVCGFFHYPNNSARDDVAYNVGNIVRKIARGDAKSASAMPDWLETGTCGGALSEPESDNKSANVDDLVQ